MAARPIILLGDPRLHEVCSPVDRDELDQVPRWVEDLHDTLMDFRARHGIGRAIAAPQIGIPKRMIYMHIDGPTVFLNPVIEAKSPEMMEVWDDCMCFPGLLVRVSRHRSCRIHYFDAGFEPRVLEVEGDLSELLQHEYDHLDGILATERAIDSRSFAMDARRTTPSLCR
ncbi:MAG: peptide deformylase [Firmicutes bacterium]|jgi:peptide deformylase|nr:peptide deformylase [Bacillota bacterium]